METLFEIFNEIGVITDQMYRYISGESKSVEEISKEKTLFRGNMKKFFYKN